MAGGWKILPALTQQVLYLRPWAQWLFAVIISTCHRSRPPKIMKIFSFVFKFLPSGSDPGCSFLDHLYYSLTERRNKDPRLLEATPMIMYIKVVALYMEENCSLALNLRECHLLSSHFLQRPESILLLLPLSPSIFLPDSSLQFLPPFFFPDSSYTVLCSW